MRYFWLIVIIILAFWIRFSGLQYPSLLTQNEQKIGLASLSILQSSPSEVLYFLKNNFGFINTTSVSPLSIFITLPWISWFGLSLYALRIPSILLSCISIVCAWVFAHKLFLHIYPYSNSKFQSLFALFTAAYLAISPWHIQLSRVNSGIMLGFIFFLLGLYLVICHLKYSFIFFLPTLLLGLSVISDVSFFIPAVYVFVLSIVLYLKSKKIQPVKIIFVCLLFLLEIGCNSTQITTSLFHMDRGNADQHIRAIDQSQDRIIKQNNSIISNIFFNPLLTNVKFYLGNASQYTEFSRLFIKWDYTPDLIDPRLGLFHLTDIVFLSLGIVAIYKKRSILIGLGLIVIFLVIAFNVYQSSKPDVQKLNTFLLAATFIILLGIFELKEIIKNKKINNIVITCILGIFFYIVTRSITVVLNPELHIPDYLVEYREAFINIEQYKDLGYKTVVVDSTYGNDLPIYWLQFTHRERLAYQYASLNNLNTFDTTSFIQKSPEIYDSNTIYIIPAGNINKGITPTAIIGSSNFKLAIIVKTEEKL